MVLLTNLAKGNEANRSHRLRFHRGRIHTFGLGSAFEPPAAVEVYLEEEAKVWVKNKWEG